MKGGISLPDATHARALEYARSTGTTCPGCGDVLIFSCHRKLILQSYLGRPVKAWVQAELTLTTREHGPAGVAR